jgi:hypothetical protein
MKTSTIKTSRWVLRGSLAALALALLLVNPAFGQYTVSITPTFTTTPLTQFAIPLPIGTVGTTFTAYSSGGGVEYVTGTFSVATSGVYSATLTPTSSMANGVEILTGVFSPSVTPPPTTPLSNFFAGIQTGSTTTIPSLTLTGGTQYSYLLLFNPGYTGTPTFTVSGPGCISLGGNSSCAAVPTLTPFAIAALSILIMGLAAFMLVKRSPTH